MKLLIKLEKITRIQIQEVIKNQEWQRVRVWMKGKTLKEKINDCNKWLEFNDFSKQSKIQIINYINALKRSAYSQDIKKYLQN